MQTKSLIRPHPQTIYDSFQEAAAFSSRGVLILYTHTDSYTHVSQVACSVLTLTLEVQE